MTDYDAVAELADRMLEKYRRGEEPGFEDRLAWDGLTDEERHRFMAEQAQKIEHGKETLEALREDIRLLKVLLRLDVGLITHLEAVHQIRGVVPESLAQQ